MTGRPTIFTAELATEICRRLAATPSLRAVCRADDMPDRGTIAEWALKHEEFGRQYMRARELGLDDLADECMEIADDKTGDVQRDRLRWDARRWYLSKIAPKRYGDKLSTEISGPNGAPIETRDGTALDIARAIAFALTGAGAVKELPTP